MVNVNPIKEKKESPLQFMSTAIEKFKETIWFLNRRKRYLAILTQSGTNAPVATVLENTIGDIVWTRDSQGDYTGTLIGAFPIGKTIVNGPRNVEVSDSTNINLYSSGSDDANTVYVLTKNLSIAGGTVSTADGLLYGAGYSNIEIIVYR